MTRLLSPDPHHTLFLHALLSAVLDPRQAVLAFGLRLLALRLAVSGSSR